MMDENPYKPPENTQPDADEDGSTAAHEAHRRTMFEMIEQLFELRNWTIGVMICVVISALVTPADPFSLLFVAIPLVVVYFIAVGVRAWLKRN